ncbi:MAG TPA: SAF domain-containing protein [Jiangellaceae bacterium]
MPIVADAEQRPGRQVPAATDLPSPAAARLKAPRWLSVRMVMGVLIVLVSVVAGVQVISAADRTVPVLVATQDLAPGQPLTSDLVELQRVRFEHGIDSYLTGEVGSGYVVVRPVGRGELLPSAAISPAADVPEVRYVTLPLDAAELPHGISTGDVVDVWLTPVDDGAAATLLLPDASVTAASTGGGGLTGASRQAQVTLAVSGDDLQDVTAQLVAAARAGRVYLAALPEVQ